jgi:hypothetical protein
MKYVERILIGLMVLCAGFIAVALLYPTPKSTKLNPIVRLNQGNQTFCTGTVINDNTIVTAAHCVVM